MSGKRPLDQDNATDDNKRTKRFTEQSGITLNSMETKDGYGSGIYEIQVTYVELTVKNIIHY